MSKPWCSAVQGRVRLALQITPNAKKNEVVGLLDDVLKIRLQAQPVEGKANEALVRYIADMLKVPKSAVSIIHGHANKRKIIEVNANHLTMEVVQTTFLPISEP